MAEKLHAGAALSLLVLMLVSMAVTGYVTFNGGLIYGQRVERDKASAAGVGRWEIEAKTGRTLFRYGR